MAEMKMVISLDAESKEIMERLISALKTAAPGLFPVEEHPVENPFPVPAPAPVEPKAEPAVAPEPEPEKVYTLDDVRARVQALITDNEPMRAKVKEKLSKYADKLVHMKKADYAAFMLDLEGLV